MVREVLKFMRKHWALTLSAIYILSPIDIVPDFLVWVLGPTVIIDDGFVLLLAIIHAWWKEKRK